jgi:hypothetical protein
MPRRNKSYMWDSDNIKRRKRKAYKSALIHQIIIIKPNVLLIDEFKKAG